MVEYVAPSFNKYTDEQVSDAVGVYTMHGDEFGARKAREELAHRAAAREAARATAKLRYPNPTREQEEDITNSVCWLCKDPCESFAPSEHGFHMVNCSKHGVERAWGRFEFTSRYLDVQIRTLLDDEFAKFLKTKKTRNAAILATVKAVRARIDETDRNAVSAFEGMAQFWKKQNA